MRKRRATPLSLKYHIYAPIHWYTDNAAVNEEFSRKDQETRLNEVGGNPESVKCAACAEKNFGYVDAKSFLDPETQLHHATKDSRKTPRASQGSCGHKGVSD